MAPLKAFAQQKQAIDEIVVTATRRETKAQETPLSITVLGAETLRTANADDFNDFEHLVPGLTAIDSGPGEKRYALRGLQSPGEPEVALYYDEIPIAGLPGGSLDTGDSQPDLKLWDIDRIEVLRGPQSTLYGNGSEGGAIRIISKRPKLDTFEGESQALGSVTDGGDPSYRLNEMVNVPIIPGKLAVRLAGYYRKEGGWIDGTSTSNIALPQISNTNINDEETWGDRASVSLQLTDDWNITGIAYYQHLKTGSSFETYPSFAVPGNPYISKSYIQTPWTDDSQMYNLISNYDFDWASLLVTSSYQTRAVDQNQDTTRFLLTQFGCTEFTWNKSCFGPSLLPADGFSHQKVSSWSGEVRLVSRGDGPLQWAVGSSVQNADTYRRSQVATVDANGAINFDPSTGDALNRLFARTNYDTFDQYSFFGEGTYEIFEALKATVGLRWFHSERTDQQVIGQQFFPGNPTGAEPFQQFEQSALFKKFELSYGVTPDALVYFEAAQGFRAGGPNFPGGFSASVPPYQADSVWDYEVGVKLSFDDKRITWNSTIFRIDWSNIQQLVPMSPFSYIVNAGSAQSDGFESELNAVLLDDLNVVAGVTYNDARLVGPQPLSSSPTSQLHAGDNLANVPRWTGSIGVVYTRKIAEDYNLTTRVDVAYQSKRSSVVAEQNAAFFVAGSYVLVNLHGNLDCGDGLGVSLDVDNLFNRYAELSAKALDSNLIPSFTAARPRTITLGVSKKF